MKENDYFLNMLSNPDFNESDFREVGLTTENTSLEDINTYKNLDFIKEDPRFQTDGKFDEAKLNTVYNAVLQSYNNFANGITTERIADEHKFYRNNIYASYEDRNNNIEASIHREANPLRQSKGLIHANDVMDSPFSIREIAQTQKVWDEATKSWQDAPNESFFNNFIETRVLAQWDSDGEHVDHFTGQTVKHKKGEKIINENGTFYYENLNGRDIYGREVLSKFDTLTVDGTFVNKFDFFDSDDKEQNIVKSVVRNAVKIVPAFIPYVSPVYLGLRVGLNTVDLLAKFGKVFTGSDSPTLSALEGFTESLSFSTSDYSQGSAEADIPAHAWSMENLLNMGADTFTQLAEQRWIFKFAPAIIKGRAGINNKFGKKAADKIKKDAFNLNSEASLNQRIEAIKNSGKNIIESKKSLAQLTQDLGIVAREKGEEVFGKYLNEYQELGRVISQAYMTGITVTDAYGEAKQVGASDFDAAFLTLGYALGEYKLLNSDIGKWILPELRAEKSYFKNVVDKLADIPKPSKNATISSKMKWINKIIDLGRKSAEAFYSTSTDILPSVASSALAEGVEEVSEEVLYDFAKSLFNGYQYLKGTDVKMSAFDDVVNRYGMSFVGGAFGGGVMGLDSGFRTAKMSKQITDRDQAFQHLVHIVKEGKANEFLSTVDRMTYNSQDLSAVDMVDAYGDISYMPGTSKDNQDKAVKDAMRQQVSIIQKILDANGALIDDESILGILTDAKKDLRYRALQNSTFAASYLQEFNDLSSKIVSIVEQLNEPVSDEIAKTEDYAQKQNELKAELRKTIDQKNDIVSGKRTGEFIEKALFEMSEDISSIFLDVNKIQWIQNKEGKKISEISEERLKALEKDWNDWSAYNRKDKLEIAFRVFKNMNLLASDMLKQYDASYFDPKRNKDNVINDIQNVFGAKIASYTALDENDEYGIMDSELPILSAEGAGDNFKIETSTFAVTANILVNKLKKFDKLKFQQYNQKINDIANKESSSEQEADTVELIAELLENDNLVNEIINDINNTPYINYATKEALTKTLEIQVKYEDVTEGLELNPKVNGNITKILNAINKKPYSPTLDLINSWTLGLKNLDTTIVKLLNQLQVQYDTLAPSHTLGEFSIAEDNAKRINIALKNIEMLKATILAARTDGVSGSNAVGYNVTANEVLKDSNLATIDKNNANVLLQDINKVEDKLKYYQRLHAINTGQKLKEHYKVQANKDIISFNKLKKLVIENDWPPKDSGWKGVDEFKASLNSGFEIIDTLDEDENIETRKLSLNEFEKVSLRRDTQKIDAAIYKFFQDNIDKLSDIDALSQLLSHKLFSFHNLDDGLLNKETKELSDTQFVWWLATRAALNPDDFYKTHKDNLISGLAPIPAQEQAIMTAVAAITNGKIFHNFAKAYNKSLENKVSELDDKYFEGIKDKRVFTKEDWMDSDRAIQFFRHFLIEGIAGSGKSTAVAKYIVNTLKQFDKGQELLNNVWFVHSSKEQAKTMASDLGYGDDYEHVYSREEYLDKISPDFSKKGIRKFEGDNLKLDKKDLIQREGETLYRYNVDINKGYTKEPPSMIFIDEVTGLSQQDLLLSEDFADHYGIMNIVFGDFVQDGLEGNMVLDETTGLTLNSQVFRGNFAGAIKLGDSLRSANGVKDHNNKVIQAKIYQILNGEPNPDRLKLKWYTDGTAANGYQDATVILGDKIHVTPTPNYEQIKADIDVLLSQLPDKEKLLPHEKLGFVYDDINSPIYKYLDELNKSGKYKDKILMKKGSSSQGLEADYYVIDLSFPTDNSKTPSKFYRQLYTGLTRAKKATVGLIQGNQQLLDNFDASEENAGEFSLDQTGIQQFSNDIKKLYDNVYSEPKQPLIYKKFNSTNSKKSTYTINGVEYEQVEAPSTIPLNPNDNFTYNDDNFTLRDFIKDSSGKTYVWAVHNDNDILWSIQEFIDSVLPKINASKNNPESKSKKKLNEFNEDKIDIINDNESELRMLLHSFATNEDGIIEEREEVSPGRFRVKYKVGPGFNDGIGKSSKASGRVDGINGLIKIMGIVPDPSGYISAEDYNRLQKILNKVRASALYSDTESEIIEELIKQVGTSKTFGKLRTRLIFKSNNIPGKSDPKSEDDWFNSNKGFSKFFKSVKEKVKGLFVKNGKHVVPTQKHLSVIITETDNKGIEKGILEIPLVNLTNPLTMIKAKGFDEVKKVVKNVESRLKAGARDVSIVDVLNESINELSTKPVKMSNNFIKLAKLYLEITNGKVLLLDEILKNKYGLVDGKITLSNIFETTGSLMTSSERGTGTGRHAEYYDPELEYSGEWTDLKIYKKDSGKAVSDIFALGSSMHGIKAGHPFVLVSDAVHIFNPEENNDEKLIEQYKKQLSDPNEKKLVKLVYVSPPTVSVQDYFKNLNEVYKKSGTVDPSIGSELTSFNILRMIMEDGIFESSALIADAFTKPGTPYDKLKQKILQLAKKQDELDSVEFLELLSGSGEIEGITLKDFIKEITGKEDSSFKSWKSFLQGQLRWYTLSEIHGGKVNFTFDKINNETLVPVKKIRAIEKMLKDRDIEGIFYSPQLSNDPTNRNIGEFKRIVNNEGIYKDKSYTINGKIDSQAYKGNVLPIIDAILESTVIPSGETDSQLTKDTATYTNDNYSLFSKKVDLEKTKKKQRIKEFMENRSVTNNDSVKNSVEKKVEKLINADSDISEDEIVKSLKKNYFVMRDTDSGQYVILDPGKNIKFDSVDQTSFTKDGKNYQLESMFKDVDGKWKVNFSEKKETNSTSVTFTDSDVEPIRSFIQALYNDEYIDNIESLNNPDNDNWNTDDVYQYLNNKDISDTIIAGLSEYELDETVKNKLEEYLNNSNPKEAISCTIILN